MCVCGYSYTYIEHWAWTTVYYISALLHRKAINKLKCSEFSKALVVVAAAVAFVAIIVDVEADSFFFLLRFTLFV